jgi:hypothetical protein
MTKILPVTYSSQLKITTPISGNVSRKSLLMALDAILLLSHFLRAVKETMRQERIKNIATAKFCGWPNVAIPDTMSFV